MTNPSETSQAVSQTSGGVSAVVSGDLRIGGDAVGRDEITSSVCNINAPTTIINQTLAPSVNRATEIPVNQIAETSKEGDSEKRINRSLIILVSLILATGLIGLIIYAIAGIYQARAPFEIPLNATQTAVAETKVAVASANVSPTSIHMPASTSSPTAILMPTPRPTIVAPIALSPTLATMTSTMQILATPTFTPTPTSTSTSTLTPTSTPTSSLDKDLCAPQIYDFIKAANDVQAGYLEGKLSVSKLTEAWGDVAGKVKSLSGKVLSTLRGFRGAMVRVTNEVLSCKVIENLSDNVVEIRTSEKWVFEAQLPCHSGIDIRSAEYPKETYFIHTQEWRILNWHIIGESITDDWTCSGQ
jgi:cytoskeletal protein RodZ